MRQFATAHCCIKIERNFNSHGGVRKHLRYRIAESPLFNRVCRRNVSLANSSDDRRNLSVRYLVVNGEELIAHGIRTVNCLQIISPPEGSLPLADEVERALLWLEIPGRILLRRIGPSDDSEDSC